MKFSEIAKTAMVLANERWSKAPTGALGFCAVDGNLPPNGEPTRKTTLREFLSSIPEECVYGLTTALYVGRNDLDATDFRDSYELVRHTFPIPDWAVNQMVGKSPFADYITAGLAAISRAGVDLDAEFGEILVAPDPGFATTEA